MIRATFEVEPVGWSEAFAEWRAVEAGRAGNRIALEMPDDNWSGIDLLVSAIVAGEAMEVGGLRRCRLVELDLPDGYLPGPALGASMHPDNSVGVIVKPSLGLAPHQVAEVARAAVAGGAAFIKDDETLGDPPWCRLEERVAAVAKVLEPGVVYCANVTGPVISLLDRSRRAVELGATGLLLNPFAMGLGALVALRGAELGVPLFAHRAGSGPWARHERFGATGAVLARLTRLCGADYVIAGAYRGKLFETDAEVDANVVAARGQCGSIRPSVVALGGGLGPDDVRKQVERAGAGGTVVLLGTSAQRYPGGLEGAVRKAVSALT
ncbi:MAG TPA: RuBisCO large subunit C-terminal-like domain-containing protein [Acidimicrobiales bacterium]|nr:RuBisCO large subunit C-terminal-like domain-containing protein [Acidimicrobiales bacterium]